MWSPTDHFSHRSGACPSCQSGTWNNHLTSQNWKEHFPNSITANVSSKFNEKHLASNSNFPFCWDFAWHLVIMNSLGTSLIHQVRPPKSTLFSAGVQQQHFQLRQAKAFELPMSVADLHRLIRPRRWPPNSPVPWTCRWKQQSDSKN